MQLGARQKDGSTLRQHLQAAAAMSGVADPLLEVPRVPVAARALWATFLTLSAVRRSGMGPHPLTLTDIEAWCRLADVRLTPWELDTLIALDAASLRAAAEAQPKAPLQ